MQPKKDKKNPQEKKSLNFLVNLTNSLHLKKTKIEKFSKRYFILQEPHLIPSGTPRKRVPSSLTHACQIHLGNKGGTAASHPSAIKRKRIKKGNNITFWCGAHRPAAP